MRAAGAAAQQVARRTSTTADEQDQAQVPEPLQRAEGHAEHEQSRVSSGSEKPNSANGGGVAAVEAAGDGGGVEAGRAGR